MSFSKFLTATASLYALITVQGVSALPADYNHDERSLQDRQCTGCSIPDSSYGTRWCAIVDSEEEFDGEAWQAGNVVKSGDDLSYEVTYTQGSSWTIGGEIGLSYEKIIGGSASLSVSVTTSIEKSATVGTSQGCPKLEEDPASEPGTFSCSILVIPGMKRVKGHMEALSIGDPCDGAIGYQSGDWEAVFPRKDRAENPVFSSEPCLCQGKGMDEANVPEKKCLDVCPGAA